VTAVVVEYWRPPGHYVHMSNLIQVFGVMETLFNENPVLCPPDHTTGDKVALALNWEIIQWQPYQVYTVLLLQRRAMRSRSILVSQPMFRAATIPDHIKAYVMQKYQTWEIAETDDPTLFHDTREITRGFKFGGQLLSHMLFKEKGKIAKAIDQLKKHFNHKYRGTHTYTHENE
jgi:hypothetical protein